MDWPFGAKPALWGSWSGSDENTGTLTLGPFRAPRRFFLAVVGFPKQAGNVVFLRRVSDGAIYGLWSETAADRWTEFLFVLPPDWANQQVEMCAIDSSTGAGGWFGVSEPYNRDLFGNLRPYWNDSSVPRIPANTWPRMLLALLASSVMLLAPGIALWPLVRRRLHLPDELALLVAIALSALIGYAVFWMYFFRPAFGSIASWVILGLAFGTIAFRVLRGEALKEALGGPEVGWAAALMAGIGLFYVGLLLLFQMKAEVSFVAQRRWFDTSLPGDNILPQLLAEKVATSEPLRPAFYSDWQASDRPPLQAGWQLLARAPLRLLLGSEANGTDTRNQIAGMILQLSWVPALWGFLRLMGLSRQEGFRLLVCLAPSGFLLVNSVFVWPKLSAAAFTLGAFTLLFQLRAGHPGFGRVIAVAGLAALAFLSHGGAMFALLALGMVLLIPRYLLGWKCTLAGAAVFLLLNVPWVTFQKFYDPPGNRLLKWHIGGSAFFDTRGVFETLMTSYREVGLKGVLERKETNLITLFGGFKTLASTKSGKAATGRRLDDFLFTFRSVGYWNLGWFVGLGVILLRRRSVWSRPDAKQLLLACGVLGLTLAIWVLLMFGPSTTVIHQGPYFANLLLLAVPAVILMRTSARLWAAISVVNAAAFFATYLPRPAAAKAPLDWMAVGLAAAAALGLLAIALWRRQADAPIESEGTIIEARGP